MLTERQIKILEIINSVRRPENDISYVKTNEIARLTEVTIRSIQNDIKILKECAKDNGARIIQQKNKGVALLVTNEQLFSKFYQNNVSFANKNEDFNKNSERILYILNRLINSKEYINSNELIDALYISRSQLAKDMAAVKDILENYDLSIDSKPNKGVKIIGDEVNIRSCIVKRNLILDDLNAYQPLESSKIEAFSVIQRILTETLVEEEFIVSDILFQNIVVHIYTSLLRMKSNNYTNDIGANLDNTYQHVIDIASKIMKACCEYANVPYSQDEANLLAINIQGKREFTNTKYISEETNKFVLRSFDIIKSIHKIDFGNNTNLRISLALHTYPLITRAKHNMQIKNPKTNEIKQQFILAYDIASVYCNELSKVIGFKISDDEIAYIALHFNVAIQDHVNGKNKKVLLISSYRKSEVVLIRLRFDQWFKNDVETFDIINPSQFEPKMYHEYDAIFTPEVELADKFNAILINLFPKENEYNMMRLSLNGFQNPKDIVAMFSQDLFFYKEINSKEQAINFLTDKITELRNLDCDLKQSVFEHEEMTGSYFGNMIALPHPNIYITERTHLAVLITKKPIQWTKSKKVQLIILVSIAKNNPNLMYLWNYLSYLLSDKKLIDRIINKHDYESFIDDLEKLYTGVFSNDSNVLPS